MEQHIMILLQLKKKNDWKIGWCKKREREREIK